MRTFVRTFALLFASDRQHSWLSRLHARLQGGTIHHWDPWSRETPNGATVAAPAPEDHNGGNAAIG